MILFSCKQSMESKLHVKSVKIGASLFLVTILTYSNLVYATITGVPYSGYLYFVIYVNNSANFFVYFWIDENFRKWTLRKI